MHQGVPWLVSSLLTAVSRGFATIRLPLSFLPFWPAKLRHHLVVIIRVHQGVPWLVNPLLWGYLNYTAVSRGFATIRLPLSFLPSRFWCFCVFFFCFFFVVFLWANVVVGLNERGNRRVLGRGKVAREFRRGCLWLVNIIFCNRGMQFFF